MFNYTPLCEERRTVILDTDIGPDCDDAGAIMLLFRLHKKYGFSVGGIVNCTSNPHGCGAAAAIARYLEEPLPLLGQFEGKGFLQDTTRYNKYLDEHMACAYETVPALSLYESVLKSAPDGGVTVITIGQFNTLAAAMKKFPSLFKKKVHAVISMAAQFPDGNREYNITCDSASAKYVLEHTTVPFILSGYEVGGSILSGYRTIPEDAERDPVYTAYRLYNKSETPVRSSWDLTAVQYAVCGDGDFYKLSPPGRMTVGKLTGRTRFTSDEGGSIRYMIKTASDDEIAAHLNKVCFL